MTIWVLDLDGVLQNPSYPHPMLFAELAMATGIEYSVLDEHYTNNFEGNEAEEKYHLSLCDDEEKREVVEKLWRKLHENMSRVVKIPGAKDLLESIQDRGGPLFGWTKGGAEIQRQRLESKGLSQYFLAGHIVSSPRKGTREGLEQDLLTKLPQGRVVLVGDRFSQDIKPALNIERLTCVWIRWPDSTEPMSLVEEAGQPNLTVVKSTQELVELVKKGAFDE